MGRRNGDAFLLCPDSAAQNERRGTFHGASGENGRRSSKMNEEAGTAGGKAAEQGETEEEGAAEGRGKIGSRGKEASGSIFAGRRGAQLPCGRVESRGGKAYLVPEMPDSVKGIRFLRNGLYLGEFKKGRFEPSEAYAMYLPSGMLL